MLTLLIDIDLLYTRIKDQSDDPFDARKFLADAGFTEHPPYWQCEDLAVVREWLGEGEYVIQREQP